MVVVQRRAELTTNEHVGILDLNAAAAIGIHTIIAVYIHILCGAAARPYILAGAYGIVGRGKRGRKPYIPAGKYLIVVKMYAHRIDELLLQRGVAYGYVQRVGVLAQRLYLCNAWLLCAALIQYVQVGLLAYFISERRCGEDVHIIARSVVYAVQQVGLHIVGVGHVAA